MSHRLLSKTVRYYVVQQGDTLLGITRRVGISLHELTRYNIKELKGNIDLIFPGQLILLECN